jgi:uncharacterized membrane protein (UPF0127 family)
LCGRPKAFFKLKTFLGLRRAEFYSKTPSPVRARSLGGWILIFILCFIFAACFSQKLPVQDISIEREGIEVALVMAEIARTPEERNKGLMFRKSLPEGEGMFFIFERDDILSFWMKNTSIPLSIAFIAYDGRIIDIKDMYPHDENSVHSSRSARFALEVPQGWFSRAGVQSGDVVKIPR